MGRRTWIKVYCDNWLRGSIRSEDLEVRAIFMDLLTLAGDSAYGDKGVIQLANGVGFTDEIIAGILNIPLEIWLKVKERLSNHPNENENRILLKPIQQGYSISIINWEKYQSEYERTKQYKSTKKVQKKYKKSNKEKEKEKEIEKKNNNIYIVLSHWNSKEDLPTHELKGQIGKRIEYEARKHIKNKEKIEDINKAIDNYAKIYSGEEYYFKYRWDLDEFLKRRGGYLNFKKDFQILHNNYYSEKLAQEKEQRLQREREKEATKREQERREREYKELEETKPLSKEEVHKLLQKALQPKKDGKIG